MAGSIVGFAGVAADLGVGTAVTRMVSFAKPPHRAAWGRVGLRVALVSGTIATLTCWGLALMLGPSVSMPLAILAPLALGGTLRMAISGFLMARRRVLAVEGNQIVQHVLWRGSAIVLAVAQVASVFRVAWAQLAARWLALLPLVASWRALSKTDARDSDHEGMAGTDSEPTVRRLLAFALPLLMATIAFQALQRSDVVMLGFIRSPADVGIYVPVLKVTEVAGMLLTVLGSYYLPITTEFVASNDWRRLQLTYSAMARWAIVLASPLLAVLLVAPTPILTLLFGQQFSDSGGIANILAAGYAVHIAAGLNGLTLAALGRTKAIAVRSVVALVVNILLNLLLIPPFGATGAALATTIVIVGLNVANSILVWRTSGVHIFQRPLIAVLFAGVAATAAAALLSGALGWTGSILQVVAVAGLVGTTVMVTALATLTKQEKALRRSLLARLKAIRRRSTRSS